MPPVFPGTAMTFGGALIPSPDSPITEAEHGALEGMRTILEARPSPPAESLHDMIKHLRRCIRRTTPALKVLAAALPEHDPRREPARAVADEAFFQAGQEDGAGNGLLSARDYCLALYEAMQDVRHHYSLLMHPRAEHDAQHGRASGQEPGARPPTG
ncbi:DUF6415 family natural product biosynthesis protein [Streptomyces gamaensis]|uniref:DUF6415 family natural product biosynthesis protein n=1 Tax=Streptomyces gamaensis TaxID=1763542 RepID=A0ABW0YUM1_9ACTN